MLLKLLLGSEVSVAHCFMRCGEKITSFSGLDLFSGWSQDNGGGLEKYRWVLW